jgi:Uma2 family endonuclease
MTVAWLDEPVSFTSDPEEMTPEDFLARDEHHRFELLDGKLVARIMGAESSEVGTNVSAELRAWAQRTNAGRIYSADCGYRCFPDKPDRVRFPDVSFVSRGRLPDGRSPKGWFRIPPDLAVEVISPNELADDMESKRVEFLDAGTAMYWILFPETRTLHIHRPNVPPLILRVSDEVRDLEELPGFACKVSRLFGEA